jgi:hypothetical protein
MGSELGELAAIYTTSTPLPSVSDRFFRCIILAIESRLRTAAPREFEFAGIDIDTDHPTSGSTQKLHTEQSDQSQANHQHRVTQADARLAHTVDGDRTHGGERRIGRVHGIGNARAQIARHKGIFRVTRDTLTATRHAITHSQAVQALADFHDHTGGAVSQR